MYSEYCDYKLSDLESLRDSDGFINIQKCGLKFPSYTAENMGNCNRLKNWVEFNGTNTLLKGETIMADYTMTDTDNQIEHRNYGVYGEPIMEEICRTIGIESAHYDLFRLNGEEGVISVDLKDNNKNTLVSLYDLIGDNPNDDMFTETNDYGFIINKLEEVLHKYGIDNEKVNELLLDFKKRLLLDICMVATDNHTENYAFLVKRDLSDVNSPEYIISLAPSFDREAILMLDTDRLTVPDFLSNPEFFDGMVQSASPRIIDYEHEKDYSINEPWKPLFKELIKDRDVRKFYNEKIADLDIEEVLEHTGERLHTVLPDDVFELAEYSFLLRKKEIEKEFQVDLDLGWDEEADYDEEEVL